MPQFNEPFYCSQQIHIPPALPDILKQFTKAAIRTQPNDVLGWSSAYFHAMANGEVPPVKDRLDMMTATQKNDTGLTPGLLRVLNKQLGPKIKVSLAVIEEKWTDLCLPLEVFAQLVTLGDFLATVDVPWIEFLALCCSHLSKDLTSSMKLLCEIVTADPFGGAARVPFPLFRSMYTYLAARDEVPERRVNIVLEYLDHDAKKQNGYIQPRNFLTDRCPALSAPPIT